MKRHTVVPTFFGTYLTNVYYFSFDRSCSFYLIILSFVCVARCRSVDIQRYSSICFVMLFFQWYLPSLICFVMHIVIVIEISYFSIASVEQAAWSWVMLNSAILLYAVAEGTLWVIGFRVVSYSSCVPIGKDMKDQIVLGWGIHLLAQYIFPNAWG